MLPKKKYVSKRSEEGEKGERVSNTAYSSNNNNNNKTNKATLFQQFNLVQITPQQQPQNKQNNITPRQTDQGPGGYVRASPPSNPNPPSPNLKIRQTAQPARDPALQCHPAMPRLHPTATQHQAIWELCSANDPAVLPQAHSRPPCSHTLLLQLRRRQHWRVLILLSLIVCRI